MPFFFFFLIACSTVFRKPRTTSWNAELCGGFEGRSVPSCPLRDIFQGTSLKRGPTNLIGQREDDALWLAANSAAASRYFRVGPPPSSRSAPRTCPTAPGFKKKRGNKTLANVSPLTAAAAAAAAEPPAFRASFTDARGGKVPWWIH